MPEPLPVVTPEFRVGQFVRYVAEGPIVALVETPDGVGVVLKIGGAEGIVLSGRQLDLIRQGPDPRDAEVERLRAQLALPCGSCHPCQNYADETWRAADRTPPHVHEWDTLRALVEEIRASVNRALAGHLTLADALAEICRHLTEEDE